jgi:glutathione S-transferase
MLVSCGMQLFETWLSVLKSDGEVQEKALKEVLEKLSVLEEGIKNIFPEGIQIIEHENVGLLDIVMISVFGPYKVHEEVLGLKLIDPEKTPLLFSWLTALLEIPVVKDSLPPHEKLVGLLKFIRHNTLNPTSA